MTENEPLLGQNREQAGTWLKSIVVCVLLAGLIASTTLAILWSPSVRQRDDEADFSSLRGYCAHVAPIGADEFLARQARLAASLAARGFSGAVFESGSDMAYFTDVRWSRSERPFLFVALANGSTAFVAPSFEATRAVQAIGDWQNTTQLLVWQEDQSPYRLADDVLLSSCAAKQSTTCRVLIGHDTRLFVASGLADSWPSSAQAQLQLVDDSETVAALRRVKSPAELDILRCVNRATKAAIAAVAPLLRDGVTQSRVKSLLFSAQSAAGLSGMWALVLFGANAAFPHGTERDLQLRAGMGVLIDTGGSLHGYQSDVSRTVYPLGADISPLELAAWNAVRDAQLAALQTIASRAGGAAPVSCGDVDAAARRTIDAAGFGADYDYFTHRLGHGIGLDGHEEPYLVRGNAMPLQAAFTFSVEPGIYNASAYGCRLEDIVAVVDQPPGYEVFGPLQTSPFQVE